MERIIAVCGLICSECPAYLAHINDDDQLRLKTSREWSEMYGAEIPPEAINCSGCMEEGVKITHCDECNIRNCALLKHINNCSECVLYPCEMIEKFHQNVPDAKKTLADLAPDNRLF